jgi:hypothetical protein
MRDFRDAKVMARALRDALRARAVETTYSEALELIAKTFGYENCNILSARIDAAPRPAGDERPVSPPAGRRTIRHCPISSTARSVARASTRFAS